ncbi:hypothetical protein KC323_g13 [Hortaea werneckii]|nr:hypothetical protein KC323_g13 [Hortaea werneckii]
MGKKRYGNNPPPNKEPRPESELPDGEEDDAASELLEPLELDVEVSGGDEQSASAYAISRRAVDFDLVLRDHTGHSALDIVIELTNGTSHDRGALAVATGRDDSVRAVAVGIVEHLLGLVQSALGRAIREGVLREPGGGETALQVAGPTVWPCNGEEFTSELARYQSWGKAPLRTDHVADFRRASGEDEGVRRQRTKVSKAMDVYFEYFTTSVVSIGTSYNTAPDCLHPTSLDCLHIKHEASRSGRTSCIGSKFLANDLNVYVPRRGAEVIGSARLTEAAFAFASIHDQHSVSLLENPRSNVLSS